MTLEEEEEQDQSSIAGGANVDCPPASGSHPFTASLAVLLNVPLMVSTKPRWPTPRSFANPAASMRCAC